MIVARVLRKQVQYCFYLFGYTCVALVRKLMMKLDITVISYEHEGV